MNYKNMKDGLIKENTLYFVTENGEPPEKMETDFDIKSIQVPNLLHPENLEEYVFSSMDYKNLSKDLKEAGIENFNLCVSYENKSAGFDRSRLVRAQENEDKPVVTDKPAYINNGELDWSKLQYNSLSELILERRNSSQKVMYVSDDGTEEQTYGELCTQALRIAKAYENAGIGKGDVLIVQFDRKKDFMESFWAAMLIGAEVVPMEILENYHTKNVNTDKLSNICRMFDGCKIITSEKNIENMKVFLEKYELPSELYSLDEFRKNETEIVPGTDTFGWKEPCLYFFTSGSTGVPKGVGLTQRNVFARTLGEIQMYDLTGSVRDFNWMTLTHAAGMIWSMIRDVYLDAFQIQAETDVILQNPLKLPEYFDKYRITTSWAPYFAYILVANAMDDSIDYGWDLSCATNIYSGGETNIRKGLRSFCSKMRKYDFDPAGLITCFGMTETSSCNTYFSFGSDKGSDPNGAVSIGTAQKGIEIRIADSDNNVLKEGEIGYLQIKGDTLLKEYYRNETATAESITPDGFLITGDMAYIQDNNVMLTGREKNIIIINGLNYNIEDIETAADETKGVSPGDTAIVSVLEDGRETIILFFTPEDESVFYPENTYDMQVLIQRIKKEIQLKCFITLHHVIPVEHNKFARSDIGKKQRNVLKDRYLGGEYDELIRNAEKTQGQYVLKKKRSEILYSNCKEENVREQIIDETFLNAEDLNFSQINEENIREVYEFLLDSTKEYANLKEPKSILFPVIYKPKEFSYFKGMLASYFRTMAIENSCFKFRLVFMDVYDEEILRKEQMSADNYDVVIYEKGKRYIETYKTVNAVCERKTAEEKISGKITVILGGAGGIGTLLCRYINETYADADILLIGRRDEASVKSKIPETDNNNISYKSADIKNYEALNKACEEYKNETNKEIGLIFNLTARGIAKEEELTIKETLDSGRLDLYTESTDIKLMGLKNAVKLRRKNNCRLYVFGSITAEFGMAHMACYAVSNQLAEEYCSLFDEKDVVFIGFSGWNNIGMNLKKSSSDMKKFLDSFSTEKNGFLQGLTAESGIRIIDSILTSDTGSCLAGMSHDFPEIRYCIDDPWQEKIDVIVRNKETIADARRVINEKYPDLKQKVFYRIDRMSFLTENGEGAGLNEVIRNLWKTALNADDLDPNENLFDLGGNSLTVFKLASDISKALMIHIKPIDIMEHASVNEFTRHIQDLQNKEKENDTEAPAATARKRKLKKRK